MIRPELKKEIESIADRLDENVRAEAATKSVLKALLGSIVANQEEALMDHVSSFARALMKAVAAIMASRN